MSKKFTKKLQPEIAAIKAKRNVFQVGRGYKTIGGKKTDKEAWVVSVERKVPLAQLAAKDIVPSQLLGLPTDVVEGKMPSINPHEVPPHPPTGRWRPAPGGVSIGHFAITAGTLSCIVFKDIFRYMLGNNHVLANCNDAKPGDPILQPGAADGGTQPVDVIGELYDFVPYEFGSACFFAAAAARICNGIASILRRKSRLVPTKQAEANLVDCAIARPFDESDVRDDVLNIGFVSGEKEPELGMIIRKSGRTTGLTTGVISQVDVTVDVSMGEAGIATFAECFVTDDMGDPGDSGSLAVDNQKRAVGLLFAGSDTETIYCKYSNVRKALGLNG